MAVVPWVVHDVIIALETIYIQNGLPLCVGFDIRSFGSCEIDALFKPIPVYLIRPLTDALYERIVAPILWIIDMGM